MEVKFKKDRKSRVGNRKWARKNIERTIDDARSLGYTDSKKVSSMIIEMLEDDNIIRAEFQFQPRLDEI